MLGHEGPLARPTTAGSPSACSTPRSAAARRAGCSRRCASAAAWPTRSSPSPATTPTPAWSASRSAACRPSSTTCSRRCGSSSPGSPRTASPRRSCTAARASCAAAWCSASRTPRPRMSRLGKAELVHDELLGIDEVLARIDAVTLEDVREVAAEVFGAPEILAIVGPSALAVYRRGPSPLPHDADFRVLLILDVLEAQLTTSTPVDGLGPGMVCAMTWSTSPPATARRPAPEQRHYRTRDRGTRERPRSRSRQSAPGRSSKPPEPTSCPFASSTKNCIDHERSASDALCRCSKVKPMASGNSGQPLGTGEPISSLNSEWSSFSALSNGTVAATRRICGRIAMAHSTSCERYRFA